MRTLTLLFLSSFLLCFGQEPAKTTVKAQVSAEDKLTIREAQVISTEFNLRHSATLNQVFDLNQKLPELRQQADSASQNLLRKFQDLQKKLQDSTGCKKCVLTPELTFVEPVAEPAAKPSAAK